MSKRMIIIENCGDCSNSGLGFLTPQRVCLKAFIKDGEQICPEEGTPDWCPLPAVPDERYEEDFDWTDLTQKENAAMNHGWNKCLEAVRKEEETE